MDTPVPSHQDRREPLPADYQFPTPRHMHQPAGFDVALSQHVCRCGARRNVEDFTSAWFFLHWNVIEGDHH